MDVYMWLVVLMSFSKDVDSCVPICSCHPEGEMVCHHPGFAGPLEHDTFITLGTYTGWLELHMDHNAINYVSNRVFERFVNLRTLNLNDNAIQKVEPKAFIGLRKLRFLDMQNNLIMELPIGLFDDQVNLVSLDIRGNWISSLVLQTFSPLVSLEQLAVGGNPLICNCQTREILLWITSRNVSEGDTPVRCTKPVYGTPWNYLAHEVCPMSTSDAVNNTTKTSSRTTISIEVSSSQHGGVFSASEEPNDTFYSSKSVSIASHNLTTPSMDHTTNTSNITVSSYDSSTVKSQSNKIVVICVVVITVLIILSVLVFVVFRRKRKLTTFNVAQDENTRSVPPPGKGQELLYDDDDDDGEDEEEGYEYVDLGKNNDAARFVKLNNANGNP